MLRSPNDELERALANFAQLIGKNKEDLSEALVKLRAEIDAEKQVLRSDSFTEALAKVLKKKPLSAYKPGSGYRKTGNNKKKINRKN